MTFEQQFYQHFLQLLIERLEQLDLSPGAESHTVVRPESGGQVSAGPGGLSITVRQSNLLPRPARAMTVLGEHALGDTPRHTPFLPAPEGAVIPVALKPPPPFGSLACVPEVTAYTEWSDDESEARFYPVHAKALAPAAGDPIADFPVGDEVRDKLWRQRGERGSPYPAWGEWAFVTQEYPDGPAVLQSGWDGEPYVAGIMRQDWRHLTVTDVMPAPVDGDTGALVLPDDASAYLWLLDTDALFAIQAAVTFSGPAIPLVNTTDPGDTLSISMHTHTDVLYDEDAREAWDFENPALFDQSVKHYRRGGADEVRTVTFARWARAFDDSGADTGGADGTITVTAPYRLQSVTDLPPWWEGAPAAEVDGAQTGTVIQVTTDILKATVEYLNDNEVWVRILRDTTVITVARVISADPGDEDENEPPTITFASSITVEDGDEIYRYLIAVPKSGSRTYYWDDAWDYGWNRYLFIQGSRVLLSDPTWHVFRAIPGRTVTLNARTVRLFLGSDDSGTLLNERSITDAYPQHGFGPVGSSAANFAERANGFTAALGQLTTTSAGWELRTSNAGTLAGDLPGMTFLHELTAGGFTYRIYAFTGTTTIATYYPHTLEDFPTDEEWLETFFGRGDHRLDDVTRLYHEEINPLIYDGVRGTLPNPAAETEGGTWCGLPIMTRWYCADALLIDGVLVGVVLDEDLTLRVSVAGAPAWAGSVFDLLPGCVSAFNTSHRAAGGATAWPNGLNPISVQPHYNFLHPSWPFPMAVVGPFAVRVRVDDDREGTAWVAGTPVPPVVLEPLF